MEEFKAAAPSFTVTEDLIGERATVSVHSQRSATKDFSSKMTVSKREPAVASAVSTMVRRFEYLGQKIDVTARCVTASDEHSFHHTSDVEATIGGERHWHRQWQSSSARQLD